MSESATIRDKILKLLALTESDNDHEALNAARMANRTLRNAGLTWSGFLDPYMPRKPQEAPRPTPKAPEPDDIWDMLEFVRDNAWPGFDFSFIDSIEINYDKYQRLTPGQLRGLIKTYNTVRASAGE